MTDEEYLAVQTQILLISRIVKDMDIAGFLARINKAETLGPILDPSLYIQASETMGKFKDLAAALRLFQMEVMKQGRKS